MIAASIVSHGNGAMISKLIPQILDFPEISRIILTQNIEEPEEYSLDGRVTIVRNQIPKGFGANHNAAFELCQEPFFCILNPDIEFIENPFPSLLECIRNTDSSVAAPKILNPGMEVENSIRKFPTIPGLFMKSLGIENDGYLIEETKIPFHPDWVGGMFMLFSSQDFRKLQGFDESFFLYYEDVDLCVRAWKEGLRIVACPSVSVIHDARRSSHRDIRYMKWHLSSILRYLFKHFGRLPKTN